MPPPRAKKQKKKPANPSPAAIRARRADAGLTQTEAGALIYCSLRAWQQYEGDGRKMHPALWELFCIKTPD